jgi:outer membrane autotransporter protein
VNILAAKLDKADTSSVWKITGEEGNKTATSLLHNNGAGDAILPRVFALGGDYEIYLGGRYKYDSDHNPSGYFVAVPKASGKSATLNVIGDICKAEVSSTILGNTVLTIDQGWEMNCWNTVKDLKNIRILNGTLTLKSDPGELQTLIEEKIGPQLSHTEIAAEAKDYRHYYPEDRRRQYPENCDRYDAENPENNYLDKQWAGVCALDLNGYTSYGQLTVGSGQKITFGTYYDEGTKEHFSAGQLVLTSETQNQLTLENGSKLGLDVVNRLNDELLPADSTINCRVVETVVGQDSIATVIDGLTIGDPIGTTGYYAVSNASNLLDKNASEYVSIENLQLLWSEVDGAKGLVIATVANGLVSTPDGSIIGNVPGTGGGGTGDGGDWNLDDIFAPAAVSATEYAKSFANGSLSQGTLSTLDMARESLSQHLTDVKGNGDDPFLTVFGGHEHLDIDADSGFGSSANYYGLLLGEDWVRPLGSNYLRFGTVTGYCSGKMDFTGPSVSGNGSKSAKCKNYFWTFFASYESFDAQQLKSNLLATLTGGIGHNDLSRTDNDQHRFNAKFTDSNITFTLDGIRSLFRWNGVQVGPWAGIRCGHIHQNDYVESRPGTLTNCAEMGSMNSDSIRTVLGLNAEKEIYYGSAANGRHFRLHGKLGWQCGAIRHHSDATGKIYAAGIEDFTANVGYGKRNALLVSAGFRNKLNDHWEVRGNWNGSFAEDATRNSANLSLGYSC